MSRYRQASGVVAREVAGELVLIQTATTRPAGDFFVLNDSGQSLWRALEGAGGANAGDLARRLIDEFDVGEPQARADVTAFLDAARSYGVVVEVEE